MSAVTAAKVLTRVPAGAERSTAVAALIPAIGPEQVFDPVLAHDYTVTDLDRLARKAAFQSRWSYPTFRQRHDLAWFAIAEALLTVENDPGFWALVDIGEKAIDAHVESEGRYRGIYLARTGVPMGTSMPRFLRYWISTSQPTRSPEEPIVEVTALRQIWPRLTKSHQAVLIALATHDDYEQAAASLSRPYRSFVSTVSTARKQFMRLWHQYETPRAVWGRDIRVRRPDNRHSITVVTVRRRERRRRAQNQPNPE